MNHLLVFGLGYSALEVAKSFLQTGGRVTGTVREAKKAAALPELGIRPLLFDGSAPSTEVAAEIAVASHILVSVPPEDDHDPIVRLHGKDILSKAANLEWIGYFSSLAVYGDQQGGWVDESVEPAPATNRGKRRVRAEKVWRDLASEIGIPLTIFRLAGIYGPGRSAVDALRAGTARRIVKPGQIFNRIHVADIAQVVSAAIAQGPTKHEIYNVCDDEPASPALVMEFAANLLAMDSPPAIPLEDAGLSPMGMSFYSESKRVRNNKIKDELGVQLIYPNYRTGLRAISAKI